MKLNYLGNKLEPVSIISNDFNQPQTVGNVKLRAELSISIMKSVLGNNKLSVFTVELILCFVRAANIHAHSRTQAATTQTCSYIV